MNTGQVETPSEVAARTLLDPSIVAPMLDSALGGTWPLAGSPCELRIERYWPTRTRGLVVEWSFQLGTSSRFNLTGIWDPGGSGPADVHPQHCPGIVDGQLRGVSIYLPAWKLLVQSPDCDPRLPHLARCLDGQGMARRFTAMAAETGCGMDLSGRSMECRILAYRPGRRAAVAYQPESGQSSRPYVLGKVHHNGRGQELIGRHLLLSEQLPLLSDGRIRVPIPEGYYPDLHMAGFSWAQGTAVRGSRETIEAAVDVLGTLHRTCIEDLPYFGVQDECTIIERWRMVLEDLSDKHLGLAARLARRITRLAARVHTEKRRTVHRDFYQSQFIVTRRTVTLLDLDTLALADPAIDLGNLIAHLCLAEAPVSKCDVDAMVGAIIHRYQARNLCVDRRSLLFYTASALFRVGAVHAMRTSTAARSPMLWQIAEMLLSRNEQ